MLPTSTCRHLAIHQRVDLLSENENGSATELETGRTPSTAKPRHQGRRPNAAAASPITRSRHQMHAPGEHRPSSASATRNAAGTANPGTTAAHPNRRARPSAPARLRDAPNDPTSRLRSYAACTPTAPRTRHVLSVPRWRPLRFQRRTCAPHVRLTARPAHQATMTANDAARSSISKRRSRALSAPAAARTGDETGSDRAGAHERTSSCPVRG
jgi:hypothetical protein